MAEVMRAAVARGGAPGYGFAAPLGLTGGQIAVARTPRLVPDVALVELELMTT